MEQRKEPVDVARTGAVPGTLGVVGLGLMGASLARAARAVAPAVRICIKEFEIAEEPPVPCMPPNARLA